MSILVLANRWLIQVEWHMANEKQTGGAERGGSGNFANDRDEASEAGKKGGEKSQGGR